MVSRSNADVAATLGWLAGEGFEVVNQSGGSTETFGNAQVEFKRKQLGVRITKDRDQWKLDVAPPGFEFLNLEYLLTARDAQEADTSVPKEVSATPATKEVSWQASLPGLITWVEEEDRTTVLEGAKEAWRVHVRQYWSTFGQSSGK